jgi:hypothetical protein
VLADISTGVRIITSSHSEIHVYSHVYSHYNTYYYKALKEEKEKVVGHYQELKGRMTGVREGEDRRLTELTMSSRKAITDLTEKLNLAEKIIRLGE